jgi:hypothetical protein
LSYEINILEKLKRHRNKSSAIPKFKPFPYITIKNKIKTKIQIVTEFNIYWLIRRMNGKNGVILTS